MTSRNTCPQCGQWKASWYPLCKTCAEATPATFYVYILSLNNQQLYVGQTNDIHARLLEHRLGKTKTTAGKEPKLLWFTQISGTRDDALAVEKKLKNLSKRNPRQVHKMAAELKLIAAQLEH